MSQNMKNQPLTRITRRACENIALWAQLRVSAPLGVGRARKYISDKATGNVDITGSTIVHWEPLINMISRAGNLGIKTDVTQEITNNSRCDYQNCPHITRCPLGVRGDYHTRLKTTNLIQLLVRILGPTSYI